MIVGWTPLAVAHLQSAWEYISRDSSASADSLIERIFGAVERLQQYPQLGRAGRVDGTRELVITGTPFIVAYREHRNQVQILAVLYGSQKWPERL